MELFHHQSKHWKTYGTSHLSKVANQLTKFMSSLVDHLIGEDHVKQEILVLVKASLATNVQHAEQELERLCHDKDSQPITYNHYYTDNVQKSRHDDTRKMIKKALHDASSEDFNKKLHISNTSVDSEKLLNALQRRVLINMDEQACSEARAGLDAFYKVARKTFVDNVAIQVIERHLLRHLPEVFSPQLVAGMSNQELESIGGEKSEVLGKRKELQALHEQLSASLKLLG